MNQDDKDLVKLENYKYTLIPESEGKKTSNKILGKMSKYMQAGIALISISANVYLFSKLKDSNSEKLKDLTEYNENLKKLFPLILKPETLNPNDYTTDTLLINKEYGIAKDFDHKIANVLTKNHDGENYFVQLKMHLHYEKNNQDAGDSLQMYKVNKRIYDALEIAKDDKENLYYISGSFGKLSPGSDSIPELKVAGIIKLTEKPKKLPENPTPGAPSEEDLSPTVKTKNQPYTETIVHSQASVQNILPGKNI